MEASFVREIRISVPNLLTVTLWGYDIMDKLVITKSVKVKVKFTNLGIFLSIYLVTNVNLLNNYIISLDYMLAISSGP